MGWLEALANRVWVLALKEPHPLKAAQAAGRMANPRALISSPGDLMSALVMDNEPLLDQFGLSIQGREPWPATVNKSSPQAIEAAQEIDNLMAWADLAAAQVSAHSLD
jgi:hypothetical protein